jgi:hypothetical protein
MSGRLTFICVLEANLALSCVPSARRWLLRLFIPKWTVRRSAFLGKAGWSWGCYRKRGFRRANNLDC